MRFMIIIILFTTMSSANEIVRKLIVAADTNHTVTQMHLLKLKTGLMENAQMRLLQKEHLFDVKLEKRNGYSMVVIAPIHSLDVNNKLLLFLTPRFSDIISMKYDVTEDNTISSSHTERVSQRDFIEQVKVWVEAIGLEWIVLLFLSSVGLISSLHSRRKMARLASIQKDLSHKQEEAEEGIKKLGVLDV
ncbi:MAG: hypothetical protein U9O64_01455 [Campylobacterota bacterium]|nr:hypothetical protein [Campylobacterota bacterium]